MNCSSWQLIRIRIDRNVDWDSEPAIILHADPDPGCAFTQKDIFHSSHPLSKFKSFYPNAIKKSTREKLGSRITVKSVKYFANSRSCSLPPRPVSSTKKIFSLLLSLFQNSNLFIQPQVQKEKSRGQNHCKKC
jgi:hypothetical protein